MRLKILLGTAALLLAIRAVWTAGGLLGSLHVGHDWYPWLADTVEHVGVACIAYVAYSYACREATP